MTELYCYLSCLHRGGSLALVIALYLVVVHGYRAVCIFLGYLHLPQKETFAAWWVRGTAISNRNAQLRLRVRTTQQFFPRSRALARKKLAPNSNVERAPDQSNLQVTLQPPGHTPASRARLRRSL